MEKVTNVSINRLDTVKDSAAYTFIGSLRSAVETYFTGIRVNPGRIRAYERQKTKYDRLIARNKTPDWKVTPAQTIDLELTKKNIRYIFDHISERYREDIARAESVNFDEKAVEFIDFMKNQAFEVSNKVTKSMARIRAIKLMEEVGIPEPEKRYRQYPFEFSGGMRQRIVIAIALSANPDILICDEPTTALDVTIQAQILELINDLKKKRRLSVIFITHNLGVVANMADRVAVMYAGKIVEYGDVNEIFYSPAHPYTWALLSSMPDLDTTDKLEAIPGTPPNMIYPPDGDAFAVRNKYALEIDFEMEPPMFEVSPTHYAATWLLHPDAPKVEMPKIIRERIARYQKEVAGRE
ncbi:MAG: ABC transporter ATP-binding protein [Eubacteriales bacterium]|nr:ABC transporter ATP-binding protein [Eubacteriales bacterium]